MATGRPAPSRPPLRARAPRLTSTPNPLWLALSRTPNPRRPSRTPTVASYWLRRTRPPRPARSPLAQTRPGNSGRAKSGSGATIESRGTPRAGAEPDILPGRSPGPPPPGALDPPRPAPLLPAGAGCVPGRDPRALGGRGGPGSRDSVRYPRAPALVARESFAKSPSPVCPARAGTPTRPAGSPLRSPRTPRLPARLARLGMVMEPRAWPGPRADVRATRSARSANAARRAASCSDFFPAKTRHLGVAGPQEAVPGAGACLLIGRRSGGKRERGWGAPPPLSTAPPPSGPRLLPALRALLGAPSGQRGCVAGPGHPPHVGPP
nr:translation initiation factor IF-2-like [Saimiri boliviensis boliviensis]